MARELRYAGDILLKLELCCLGEISYLPNSLPCRYCQKLPSDRYTVLTPVFKTESCPICNMAERELVTRGQKYWYRSVAALPMSCPIKEDIEVGQMGHRHAEDVKRHYFSNEEVLYFLFNVPTLVY